VGVKDISVLVLDQRLSYTAIGSGHQNCFVCNWHTSSHPFTPRAAKLAAEAASTGMAGKMGLISTGPGEKLGPSLEQELSGSSVKPIVRS
jgi:hypothetical protein